MQDLKTMGAAHASCLMEVTSMRQLLQDNGIAVPAAAAANGAAGEVHDEILSDPAI